MRGLGVCAAFLGPLLIAGSVWGATPIASGSLATDATWAASHSPYVLAGDFTVQAGATLTIEPGVEVQIASGDSSAGGADEQRIEWIIDGALHAAGTAAAPIWIHAQSGPGANAWSGIVISAGATSARLEYLAIEDANNALTDSAPGTVLELSHATLRHNVAAIWLTAGSPALHDSLLAENTAYGVFALANAHDIEVSITNSVLRANGSYGVYLTSALGHQLNATLGNCTIYGNISAGVTGESAGAGSQTKVLIQNSIISSNGILGLDSSALDGGVSEMTTTFSDIWSNGQDFSGTSAGAGCLAADPAYRDAPKDLRVLGASPCIDAGTLAGAPSLDFLGRARPAGSGVDLGAYEHYPEDDALVEVAGAGGNDSDGGAANGGNDAGGAAGEAPGGSGGALGGGAGQGGQAYSAGAPDSVSVPPASGCGCRLSGTTPPPTLAGFGFGVAALAALRARARRQARGRVARVRLK